MQQSDFKDATEIAKENGPSDSSADPTLSKIAAALDQGDHETAGAALREALERAPDDKQLLRLAAKQRRQAERFTRVYSLLKETHAAIGVDEFVRALGAYREAANLSQGFADLEQATFKLGVSEAEELGDRNWRIARTLLEDAAGLNPELVVPEQRWQEIKAAEREETIANVLAETALAKPAELERARDRLRRTLDQYPDDAGLAARLKSIESTIDDKRKWDERQKCFKKLTDLRDALQRETDTAQAGKYMPQSEALAGAYGADPEFSDVLEDLKHQVISSEKAQTALHEDRIEDCLEECAWVLSRMRHHQLFLSLKKQAEERELSLADSYSSKVTQIRGLLDAGKIDEADKLCAKARVDLPQFTALKELSQEIETRRSKQNFKLRENADSAQRYVERAERHLRDRQYKLAEQFFHSALKQLPDDKKLQNHILGLLHGFARSVVKDSPQSADEVLRMASRLLPGTAVPADLADALKKKKPEPVPIAPAAGIPPPAVSKIPAASVASPETAAKDPEVIRIGHGRPAASRGLFNGMVTPPMEVDIKPARGPAFYRILSVAATILLGLGLAYWLNNRSTPTAPAKPAVESASAIAPQAAATTAPAQPLPTPPASQPAALAAAPQPSTGSLVIRSEVPGAQVVVDGKQYTVSKTPLKVELSANSHQVSGSRQGYQDFGPVTVAVNKSQETVLDVKLAPKPASLEISGAEAGTKIKLDGVLLGKATANHPLTKELPAGQHSIELSRDGFVTKTLTRNLAPGDAVVLNGRDLQLESSDARLLAARAKADESRWQSVDKSNPDALRAFANQYPYSPFAGQAKQQADTVLLAREMKVEDTDWSSADHNSRASLEDFLKRHPNGRHAPLASSALADLERKTARPPDVQVAAAEEAAWKKVNRHDEASLESFARDFPASRYRPQVDLDLATIRLSHPASSETAAVLTVLSRFATAWNAKDLNSILAIQKNLDKRKIKNELSQLKELDMQISPASPPQIEGTQAVVLCRRHASQTFSDGTRKQFPEVIVSYVLEKHDGNWTIEGTR